MVAIDIDRVSALIRDVAAAEIMPRWRNLASADIERKSHAGDLVTVADRAAEIALAELLRPLVPGSVVIGEEGVHANPDLVNAFRGDAPVWVLDPIDGTRAFTEGRTEFDVMVALVQSGRPLAGWIFAPADDVLYAAEVGAGAICERDGQRVAVTRRTPPLALDELQGIVTPQYFLNRRLPNPEPLRHRFRGFTRHTSAGHNYGRLMSGEADFLINFSTNAWDHFPGLALVEAVGMHARRHDANPLDPLDKSGGILVAPDPESWRVILDLLVPFS
jgi:fructose-1,6-bisphosphatase/inositol monophosphatase family enzyme